MHAPDRDPSLFEDLAPPPGGLRALRRRLDAERRREPAGWRWAFVPALAAAAVVVFLLLPRSPEVLPPLDNPVAVRLGLAPAPAGVEVRVDDDAPLLAVAGASSDGVSLYWFAGRSGAPAPRELPR